VPAIATVRGRIDYARNEAAPLCHFAQSMTGLCRSLQRTRQGGPGV